MLLSDVCLSVAYVGPNSRTERPRKIKIGTEVAHIRCDSDTTFKVKGQLVADVLNSQCTRTVVTWQINTKILLCRNSTATWRINAKTLSTCRGRRHIVSPHAQLVTNASRMCQHVQWSGTVHSMGAILPDALPDVDSDSMWVTVWLQHLNRWALTGCLLFNWEKCPGN